MYRPPAFKTTEVVGIIKAMPRTDLHEFANAWGNGEIIPSSAADASWCFSYAELFREIGKASPPHES